MATLTQTRGGFPMGWICFVALILAVVVLAPMMVMPVEMIDVADYECGGKISAEAKAPADMDDAELRAELEAAQGEVLSAEDGGTLEEKHDALAKHGALLKELAHRRGWDLYADADLSEISASVQAAVTSGPAVEIPGLTAPVHVAWSHIRERHGFGAFDMLARGPNKQRNCKEGKTYVYKKAPEGDTWILGIIWNDVLVTVYQVTHDMLMYYFSADDCPPPLNGGHDAMSSAY